MTNVAITATMTSKMMRTTATFTSHDYPPPPTRNVTRGSGARFRFSRYRSGGTRSIRAGMTTNGPD
jgi:hypothetical protein